MGTITLGDRLLEPSYIGQPLAEPLMGGGVAGIEGESFSEFGLAGRKIPVELHLVGTQIGMRTRQRGVKFEGLLRRSFGFGNDFPWVSAGVIWNHGIDIGQAGIGKRIVGIFIDRLVEER